MDEYERKFQEIWGTDPADPSSALKWIQTAKLRSQSEDLWIDFKKKSDARKLGNDEDKANIAKAISGFANTDGGLIIWGVDARKNVSDPDDPDVVKDTVPIKDLQAFKAWLDDECHQRSTPPVPGIYNRAVPLTSDSNEGFVITVIPKKRDILIQADGPKNSKTGKGYYIRSGSGFHVYPPGMIAEFYSRRPPPRLECSLRWCQDPEVVLAETAVADEAEETEANATWSQERQRTFLQFAEVEWRLEVRNEGRGSAEQIAFDCRALGVASWRVLTTGYERVGARGSPVVQYGPAPISRMTPIDSESASGRLLECIHPGQREEIATGTIRLPLHETTGPISAFSIEAQVYCLDATWHRFESRQTAEELRHRYGTALTRLSQEAPPAVRSTRTPGRKLPF